MRELAGEILEVMVYEWGSAKVIQRLADPFWFQSLGCLLGFDWHSSGLTTTTTGALKEALKEREKELGIFVAGGKGKTALKTLEEIDRKCDEVGIEKGREIKRASRLTAKVDNNALQDGYMLYHHTIFFTKDGHWCVIQQGMNENTAMARRYHWLGREGTNFTSDPHHAVCCNQKGKVLNLVASEAEGNRQAMVELAREGEKALAEMELVLKLPRHHYIGSDQINPKRFKSVLLSTYESKVRSFEELLLTKGAGSAFLRALALTSEVIYGEPVSFRDPARFSFAHGGKDGHPYPVSIRIYKHTIEMLKEILNKAKMGHTDKIKAFRRLSNLEERLSA